jgi:hypothetical protein
VGAKRDTQIDKMLLKCVINGLHHTGTLPLSREYDTGIQGLCCEFIVVLTSSLITFVSPEMYGIFSVLTVHLCIFSQFHVRLCFLWCDIVVGRRGHS